MTKRLIYSNPTSLKIIVEEQYYHSQYPMAFQCEDCLSISYIRSFNYMKKDGNICCCKKDTREGLFCRIVKNMGLDYSLIRQPVFMVNGQKRSFDFVLMPGNIVSCYNFELLDDTELEYIFIEVLDRNHIYKNDKRKSDIENRDFIIDKFPNSKIVYVNMPFFKQTNHQEEVEYLQCFNLIDKDKVYVYGGGECYDHLAL